jgi:hypothetical protein
VDLATSSGRDWLSGLLRVRPVVLDTGPLTCDVMSAATSRSGLPSPLNVAMHLGVLRGFAASHVWAEVPRVLAKRAGRADVPFEVLERIWWHEYVPLIRFVDCTGLPVTEEAANLAARDPSDSNTLVLAGLLAPVVIIAEDRDLLASGLAYEQWRDLYDVAETVHKGNSHLRGAAMAAALTGYGLIGAGKAAIRGMRNPWVLAVAGIGALLLYTSVGSFAPRLRSSWQRGADSRREIATAMGEALTAAALRVRQAEATWASAERGAPGGTLLHRLAGVLGAAEAPMTRTELVAALDLPGRRATMADLARLLYGHCAFYEVHRAGGNSGARRSTSVA